MRASMRIMSEAESVVCDLFARYRRASRRHAGGMGRTARRRATKPAALRRIADFIAGMTDRYALVEHARLFENTPELR